jgi:hypothetical protein
MPQFTVTVQKYQYVSGTIEVEADSDTEAIGVVHEMMDHPTNPLQAVDPRIMWDVPVYEEDSFDTTGDVDEA